MMPQPSLQTLPVLRQELRLHPAPAASNGAPQWTLEDPIRNQFFQLGWLEAEMIAHWVESPTALLDKIRAGTTLKPNTEQLTQFVRFLQMNQLVQAPAEQIHKQYQQSKQAVTWYRWLFQRHLSFRIPLCRPDRWLTSSLAFVLPLMTRTFMAISCLAGGLGLWLASHQWQQFTNGFSYLFSTSGIVISVMTVVCVKVLHELGHAFCCKKYGGRVATMGINFIVCWPVLYTDVTTAWRIPHKKQRILISSAGLLTEAMIAAWALLLWNFCSPGLAQSVLLTLATTSFLLSLSVNLSPLMRFDGYFIFSDWLDMPNLQQRANKIAQWKIRQWLWGWQDNPPEPLSAKRQKIVLCYAFAMWIYRITMYFGIALAVYHLAFKALGILLCIIDIALFLLMPCYREIQIWVKNKSKMKLNIQTKLTLCFTGLLLAMLLIPWQQTVKAPAVWLAKQQTLFVARNAQLLNQRVQEGQRVNKGEILFELSSPELDQTIEQLTYRKQSLIKQIRSYPFDTKASSELGIVRDELHAVSQRLEQQMLLKQQLTVRAPFSGKLVDITPHLANNDWLMTGQPLATLISTGHSRVEAYIDEQQLARVKVGAKGKFIAENLNQAPLSVELNTLAQGRIADLQAHPELSSPYQGSIAATINRQTQVPEPKQALYLATLESAQQQAPQFQMRGQVIIDGEGESVIARVWQALVKVVIRESVM
ncbi:HlyD family efflux transporter periplasmic adaptor subunit [Vibrio nitrifigilis]|uniref:HlyD family efflux transporter periplasmic adaptor subunit n=1 Tax=Vibrio nitrifigilis TaxID=2789781 RepID=A0ABS0GK82_9VIBR|nr:HlyD family efflux transporter periplasmic adaptor subunit [Vibrio nitrifigilis]MBF9002882.1 HlyD family efflux transporter periplasmic adaptor subunit [Vibrio nitrifigilis]